MAYVDLNSDRHASLLYLGDAEVSELDDPRTREEDVLRLEVPVQNLTVVDVL